MVNNVIYRLVMLVTLTAGCAWAWWQWQSLIPLVLLLAGLGIGVSIVVIDAVFGRQWYQPIENVPITRSSLFVVALLPLSIYVITSAGSVLGTGLVLGLVTSIAWQVIKVSSRAEMQTMLPLSHHFPELSLEIYQITVTSMVVLAMLLAVMSWN